MGYPSEIFIIDLRMVDSTFGENDPVMRFPLTGAPKATSMVWGSLDECIISGHENGDLAQWDLKSGKKVNLVSEHGKTINDMQLSRNGSLLITASKDTTAKLFDAETLECLKTYKTERPVNSAAISPIMDHVGHTFLSYEFPYNFHLFTGGARWWSGSHGCDHYIYPSR
jgi:translation initiation factor 3 subunit I